MQLTNMEVKAVATEPDLIRNRLKQRKARFIGIDFQTDIYFDAPNGRLKLRQGNIENALIFYERDNTPGAKRSEVIIQSVSSGHRLLEILSHSMGILIEVRKEREIYIDNNVKIYLDKVEGLGTFVEIEATDKETNDRNVVKLQAQCQYFVDLFGLKAEDMLSHSYSDLLLTHRG